MSEKADYNLKILTIGESGVGKTCILLRYTENKFLVNHIITIGIDFKSKLITCGNKSVKLKIWDTAGQERFKNITKQYYKGADGILLVYDITDRNSFEKIRDWMAQIKENSQKENVLILLGNKCDLEERQVSYEEGQALAEEYGIPFFETSSYKDINVNKSFETLVEKIISKREPDVKNDPIHINNPNKTDSGCCK